MLTSGGQEGIVKDVRGFPSLPVHLLPPFPRVEPPWSTTTPGKWSLIYFEGQQLLLGALFISVGP